MSGDKLWIVVAGRGMVSFVELGRKSTLGAAALLGALISTGCSALVDTEADQCQSTADCTSRGGEFAQSVCSSDKVCVPLLTADCIEVAPKDVVIDDSTILVGFMSPLLGDFASNGLPQWEGVQLAVTDIQKGNGGLPMPDGTVKSFAVIACHDFDNPIGVANHLARNVRVPAILGPAFSGITVDVATQVAIPSNTLLVPSSATSPAITTLSDKGLVWRTCPSDALQAIPQAKLVADLEEIVKSEPPMPTSIKVAMAVKDDAYGRGLADAVIPLLSFNGKTAAENGPTFFRVDYDDPAENPDFDFQDLVQDVVAFSPHILLLLGTNETITDIMVEVEKNWSSAAQYRPTYIFADGGRLDELLSVTAGNNELISRVIGTAPGRVMDQRFLNWSQAFQGQFGHPPLTYADTAYDSAILTAFAIVSLQGARPTGPLLAEGLKKTVEGPSVDAPAGIGLGFSTLLDGGTVDYNGISGPLDFDVNTGDAPANIDVWCISGGNFVGSGQFYDAMSEAVEGDRGSPCPTRLHSLP